MTEYTLKVQRVKADDVVDIPEGVTFYTLSVLEFGTGEIVVDVVWLEPVEA